ncbi:MAG: glycosyltransferase family 1 protein [Burkholderiaceae bacterium]|nr:glycosyltransferase family 1 protein [Burkholderiaceae bacterium]
MALASTAPTVPTPAAPPALRIAYVTETWPPEVNGVSLSAARFVQGLVQRGHRVTLLRPHQGQRERAALAQHDPAIHLEVCAGSPLPLYPDLRMGWARPARLQQLWRHRRPDLVHVATEGPLGWAAVQAAHRLGLPVTSDFRTNFHAYSRHYRFGWSQGLVLAWLRAFHRRCDLTLVPTEALRRELAGQGFERLDVVARGVDTARFHPECRSEALRACWGVAPQDPVLLCVGRLAPEKNLLTLVQACEALQARHPRARLLLVGDGPQRAALQARCPNAIFAGPRHGDDLAAHYASADLFAFPSLTETYGNVTPEALASGLALLAYDHAAAAELVRHGENGLLAAPGDAADFTRLLGELLDDPARRRALGRQARASMLDQGWERVVERFESLLRQRVEARGRTTPQAGHGIAAAHAAGAPVAPPLPH